MRILLIAIGLVGACTAEPAAVVVADGQRGALGLAVDGDDVYWTGERGVTRLGGDGARTAYGADYALAVAAGGGGVFWSEAGGVWSAADGLIAADHRCVFAMATDGAWLAWASAQSGDVWVRELATGDQWRAAEAQGTPTGVALAAGRVFWTSGQRGAVTSVGLRDRDPRTHATDQAWPVAVAAHGDHVYWATDTGAITRAPIAGGAPEPLASGAPIAGFGTALAVTDTDVVWIAGRRVLARDPAGTVRELDRADALAVAGAGGTVVWSTWAGEIVRW